MRGTHRLSEPRARPPTRCRGGSEGEFSTLENGRGRMATWGRAYLIPHVHAHRAGLARLLQALPAAQGGNIRGRPARCAPGPPQKEVAACRPPEAWAINTWLGGVSHWPQDAKPKEDTAAGRAAPATSRTSLRSLSTVPGSAMRVPGGCDLAVHLRPPSRKVAGSKKGSSSSGHKATKWT